MSNFKTQVELSKHAYEVTNGDKELMMTMVATLLAENPQLLKESKRNELDAKGPKGYESYAKVKVREYFTRTLKQAPAKAKPEPKSLTEAFCPNPDADVCGTSLKGRIQTSYAQLVEAFGEPIQGDGYKVSGEWVFSGLDGEVFTIYDWKSTDLYDEQALSVEEFRAQPSAEFNVGGSKPAFEFIDWVNSKLNADRKLRAI